jgi:translation initiation factor IF-1
VTEVEGEVVEQLPSARYRVRLDGRGEVVAHLSGDPRRNFIRILVGDRVRVRLASHDLTKGAILAKLSA